MSINQLQVIESKLNSKEIVERLAGALGLSSENQKGIDEAKKYIGSVLAEIKRTAGDDKKDLTVCSPDSIAQAMIDAAKMRVAIDGRKHAHLVKYGNNVQLQMGVAGFVAKITEHFPDATIGAEVVYEGDTLTTEDVDGYEHYKFSRKNNFESDISKIIGAFAVISYSSNGRRFQHVEKMPRSEIDKIRAKAKQDYIWREWFTEKAKVAVIRRACKIPFQSIQGLQEIIEYDNDQFDLQKEVSPISQEKNIVDNLNEVIEGEIVPTIVNETKFLLTTRQGEKSYENVEEWEKACYDLINKLNKQEQFSAFIQKNGVHFDEISKNHESVTARLNKYMVDRQEKLFSGEVVKEG